jgi:hypothetical protein
MEREQHAAKIVERLQSLALEQEISDIIDLYALRPEDAKPSSADGLEIDSPRVTNSSGAMVEAGVITS